MKKKAKKVVEPDHIIRPDGKTTCCSACTSCDENGVEYCKGCYEAVTNPGPKFVWTPEVKGEKS